MIAVGIDIPKPAHEACFMGQGWPTDRRVVSHPQHAGWTACLAGGSQAAGEPSDDWIGSDRPLLTGVTQPAGQCWTHRASAESTADQRLPQNDGAQDQDRSQGWLADRRRDTHRPGTGNLVMNGATRGRDLAPAVSARGVSMTYVVRGAAVPALDDLSLELGSAEFVALIGRASCRERVFSSV